MFTGKQLDELLSEISSQANSAARRYGVHYDEYDRNGQWRPCPEAFSVHYVFNHLVALGFNVTAEAHEGGIWRLGNQPNSIPDGADKRRYDLAIWKGRGNTPRAVCEFKWSFARRDFLKEAENAAHAARCLGFSPILCLLVANEDQRNMERTISRMEGKLVRDYGVHSRRESKIEHGSRYFLGEKLDDAPIHFQTVAWCLETSAVS